MAVRTLERHARMPISIVEVGRQQALQIENTHRCRLAGLGTELWAVSGTRSHTIRMLCISPC